MSNHRPLSPGETNNEVDRRLSFDQQSQMFGEWVLVKQGTSELQQHYVNTQDKHMLRHVKVFAIGSPRRSTIVVTCAVKKVKFIKRITVDVRDGSWHTWLDKLDDVTWEVC